MCVVVDRGGWDSCSRSMPSSSRLLVCDGVHRSGLREDEISNARVGFNMKLLLAGLSTNLHSRHYNSLVDVIVLRKNTCISTRPSFPPPTDAIAGLALISFQDCLSIDYMYDTQNLGLDDEASGSVSSRAAAKSLKSQKILPIR